MSEFKNENVKKKKPSEANGETRRGIEIFKSVIDGKLYYRDTNKKLVAIPTGEHIHSNTVSEGSNVSIVETANVNGTINYEVSASGGSSLITANILIEPADFASLRLGKQLLPTPDAGTWQDVKEIIYKYSFNTTAYFGLDAGNVFGIFGGGLGVKYQIQTNVEVFKNPPEPTVPTTQKTIWKQYPQTREDYPRLAYEPSGVFTEGVVPLTAYLSRENLQFGDGVLEMEIIYEVKNI